MNQQYLSKLTIYPKEQNVDPTKPGTNVTLKPNYFHFHNKKFRIGDDFLSLRNNHKWHKFHTTEGKIKTPSIETFAGICYSIQYLSLNRLFFLKIIKPTLFFHTIV